MSRGVTGTVSYDSTTKTAKFTPSSPLNYSTTYVATITTSVKDTSGNALSSNYLWSFTTATAATTPTLASTPTPKATPTPTPVPTQTQAQTPTPVPTQTQIPTPTPTPTPLGIGIILGMVSDAETGKGVSGAEVSADKGGHAATTDRNGSYRMMEVESGEYKLTAIAEGYETFSRMVRVNTSEVTDVTDESGDPVESVSLKLTGPRTKTKMNTVSDTEGKYEFTDLEADKYSIIARKSSYKRKKVKATLGEGEEKEVGIEMEGISRKDAVGDGR